MLADLYRENRRSVNRPPSLRFPVVFKRQKNFWVFVGTFIWPLHNPYPLPLPPWEHFVTWSSGRAHVSNLWLLLPITYRRMWFFVSSQIWLQSDFWREDIKACWVLWVLEPEAIHDITGKEKNVSLNPKYQELSLAMAYEILHWLRELILVFWIDGHLTLYKMWSHNLCMFISSWFHHDDAS